MSKLNSNEVLEKSAGNVVDLPFGDLSESSIVMRDDSFAFKDASAACNNSADGFIFLANAPDDPDDPDDDIELVMDDVMETVLGGVVAEADMDAVNFTLLLIGVADVNDVMEVDEVTDVEDETVAVERVEERARTASDARFVFIVEGGVTLKLLRLEGGLEGGLKEAMKGLWEVEK